MADEVRENVDYYQTTQSPAQTTQSPTQTTQSPTQTTQSPTQSLTQSDNAVLSLIRKHPALTQRELAMELGWTVDRVKYYLNKLKKQQVIRRVGSRHNGYWEVMIL